MPFLDRDEVRSGFPPGRHNVVPFVPFILEFLREPGEIVGALGQTRATRLGRRDLGERVRVVSLSGFVGCAGQGAQSLVVTLRLCCRRREPRTGMTVEGHNPYLHAYK